MEAIAKSRSKAVLKSITSIEQMASRIGSFPVRVATSLLAQEAPEAQRVLDPFSGKGTTVSACRALGKAIYAVDASPEAALLSSAKAQNIELDECLAYISRLPFSCKTKFSTSEDISTFFSPRTLSQLLCVRQRLRREIASSDPQTRRCAIITTGLLLGILHGHSRNALSVQSSHSISMAPAYVKRYCKEKGLEPPDRDVRACLKAHAEKVIRRALPRLVGGMAKLGRAEHAHQHFRWMRGRIDAVLTSPPYLHKQTYAKDNWLRLWFLGYEYRRVQKQLIETASLELYRRRVAECMRSFDRLLREGGVVILVSGVVRKSYFEKRTRKHVEVDISSILSDELEKLSNYTLRKSETHFVDKDRRYFGSLRQSNGHLNWHRKERIIVLQKHADLQ